MPAVAVIAIIGAAVAATGAAYSAYETNRQAKEGQKEANKQADNASANAASDAEQIRERGRRLLSTQRAALGASGGKIDDGSGSAVQMDTKKLTERDALLRVRQGEQEAEYFRGLSKQFKRKGRSAIIAGGLGVGQAVAGGMPAVQQATAKKETVQTQGNSDSQFTLGQRSTAGSQPKYSLLTGDTSINGGKSYEVN